MSAPFTQCIKREKTALCCQRPGEGLPFTGGGGGVVSKREPERAAGRGWGGAGTVLVLHLGTTVFLWPFVENYQTAHL